MALIFYFLFVYSIVSFRPVTYKAFQQKFKQAEDMATQMLMPGAHSNRPGEEGEQLPPWMVIFHRFFELKKNQLSKSAAQEQLRIQIRTMQNTILPNVEPLGAENATTEQRSEVATQRNNNVLASVNSSVAPGGTLTLSAIPTATARNNERNAIPTAIGSNNERSVRRRVSSGERRNNSGSARSVCEVSSLVEMMQQNTRALLRRTFAEVQRDYESSMISLQ
jgi:hypothetical protein